MGSGPPCLRRSLSRRFRFLFGGFSHQQFFDFNQDEIIARLVAAGSFRNLGAPLWERPDLYNPIWINVTFCFALALAGNISEFFSSPNRKNFHFDYPLVGKAFAMVIAMCLIIPILVYIFFCVFGINLTTKNVVGVFAVYSYSNIFFIAACLLCLIPINRVMWLGFLVFGMISILFLNLNYQRYIKEIPLTRKNFVFLFVTGFQVLAILLYKMVFF